MMDDQNSTTTTTTTTRHLSSSYVAVTVATTTTTTTKKIMSTSTLTNQQQQNEENEEEKKEGIIFLTAPRERDIILLLNSDDNDNDNDSNSDSDSDNANKNEEEQQQHHIGNIRYQNFTDNTVSIHHRHHHRYHPSTTAGSSTRQQNNNNGNGKEDEKKLVSNIIDTIYRHKGSFITKQQCRWSTVIDRDIIGNKLFHSLLSSRRKRKATQSIVAAKSAAGVTATTTTMAAATSTATTLKRRSNNNNNNNNNDDDDDKLEELPPSKKGKKTDKSLLPPPTTATFTTNSDSSIAFDASRAAAAPTLTTTTTNNNTVPVRIDDDFNDENISDIKESNDDDDDDDDDEHEHDDKEEKDEEEDEHEHDYKYYEILSSGCLTFGQSEESYEDIVFRSCKRNNGCYWKEQIFEDMKKISRRYHDHGSDDGSNGIRLRILFSSRFTNPQDVINVLQYMIDSNFFNFNFNNKRSNTVNHLAFGLIEVVNDYELDIKPISFPINIFGEVLKSIMQTSSAEQQQQGTSGVGGSGCSIPLQSLNIKILKFIGTRNEFNNTFEQLSKCNTIKEFIFESCRFQVGSIRNATTNNNNGKRIPRSCTTNTQIFNLMFSALQKITSLEVLSINDIALEQSSNSFNQILLKQEVVEDLSTMKQQQQQQQGRKKKKKLKVLSIRECTISDSTLEVIFGGSKSNSRVEKLCLVDVISSKEQRCKLIQYIRGNDCDGDGDNLTISKNRSSSSLKYLSLNWFDDGYFSVSQTIDLMNALEVNNNSLKVLHLDVDCTSNALCDKESSFINSIQKLSGLQILHLTLSGMSGQKGLECISSIVRYGIGQNTSLKKVDLLVSGYYHRQRTEEQKDDFRNEFSNGINSSLIHALTTTTSTSSSSSCDDLDGDEDVCSTSVSRGSAGSCSGSGCVLEDFYLYVDGTFSIDLNDEVQFWLSMNENNLKQKLMSDLNNYKLWIDSIIEHQLDERIVYYLLRQNPALLLFLLPSNQQTNQPNYDNMMTTPSIEEVV